MVEKRFGARQTNRDLLQEVPSGRGAEKRHILEAVLDDTLDEPQQSQHTVAVLHDDGVLRRVRVEQCVHDLLQLHHKQFALRLSCSRSRRHLEQVFQREKRKCKSDIVA